MIAVVSLAGLVPNLIMKNCKNYFVRYKADVLQIFTLQEGRNFTIAKSVLVASVFFLRTLL